MVNGMASLTIREYAPPDSDACKRLEVVASQFQVLGGLIKSAMTHHGPFDAKARQFEQCLILVVIDETCAAMGGGGVVGVIAVAVKRAHVFGAMRNIGFVFDLRVDQTHQRRGIAHALSMRAEAAVAQPPYSCEYLYLSVNGTNYKAKGLYASMGWSFCSGRKLTMSLLTAPAQLDASVAAAVAAAGGVRRVEAGAEATRAATEGYAARRDLELTAAEMSKALFGSPLCLGTFSCADGRGSSASISLWHSSNFNGFTPVRLVLPWSWWVRAGPVLGAAGMGGAALAFGAMLAGALARHRAGEPLASLAQVGGAGALAFCGARTYWFIHWLRARTSFRARLFGATYEGPAWEPLMRAAVARAHDQARSEGFAMLVVNTDQLDPINSALRPPQSSARRGLARLSRGGGAASAGSGAHKQPNTEFWHKSLSADMPSPLPTLAPDAFFDPRDF
jgi:GNAT superfamily N-acetyltransferase